MAIPSQLLNALPGDRVNVRESQYEPMYRVVKKIEKRGNWLYWYWQPEERTPEGRIDCGYSGVGI